MPSGCQHPWLYRTSVSINQGTESTTRTLWQAQGAGNSLYE